MWGSIPAAAPSSFSGRTGAGAASGGRRFPPAVEKRSPVTSLAENKEPAGLLAALWPGNGRRLVGEGEAARSARSRQLHAAGRRLPPAGGALPSPPALLFGGRHVGSRPSCPRGRFRRGERCGGLRGRSGPFRRAFLRQAFRGGDSLLGV